MFSLNIYIEYNNIVYGKEGRKEGRGRVRRNKGRREEGGGGRGKETERKRGESAIMTETQ